MILLYFKISLNKPFHQFSHVKNSAGTWYLWFFQLQLYVPLHLVLYVYCNTLNCCWFPVDSSSKHALHGFFDSLRVELAPRGLHVTTICPGYISTQLSANALRGDGSMHSTTDPATASGMAVDAVARHILTAVASRERETVIATIAHRCALYIQMLCPSLLDWVLMKRARID